MTRLLSAMLLLSLLPPAWAAPNGQPVKWLDYGSKALEQARREGKPLFMVLTATWCQWCHAYERESLHSPEVAALLNKNYVPVWVDVDRRPDVAARYPGRGLPRTVILNPAGGTEASVAGYIPGPQLRDNLRKTLHLITPGATVQEAPSPKALLAPGKLLEGANEQIERQYDPIYHGFGHEAKFPHPGVLNFMLSGDARDGRRVHETLKAIAGEASWQRQLPGGLFDPREGGFYRYSTQRNWSEPHVEKLLGLNAQLVVVALKVYGQTHDAQARAWAESTLYYLMGRLGARSGEFYASQIADTAYYRLPPEGRGKRAAPAIDRRHFAAPSAQMAIALFEASEVLAKPDYAVRGRVVLAALAKRVDSRGAIAHDWGDGQDAGLRGILDDQAWSALAMLEGWRLTRERAYLTHAEALLAFIARERQAAAGYRLSEEGAVILDANAAAALAFARAYRVTGKRGYARAARHAMSMGMERDLEAGYGWLAARWLGSPHGR